ncbi:MAG: DUF2279 domain-containing protein [bacterium]|nr:DUF2279 domain-containing protein [bacterium]
MRIFISVVFICLLLPALLAAQSFQHERFFGGQPRFLSRIDFGVHRDSTGIDRSSWVSRQPDSWIGADKAEHFLVSFWLAGGALATLKATRNNEDQSTVSCFGVTFGLGIAKEIYDLRHPKTHQASWKDLTADLLGTACGILLAKSI